jgi:orotidine-5'-phosphate decarboxylase
MLANAEQRARIPLDERLIVALDLPSAEKAKELVVHLGDAVNFYKIGLSLYFVHGGMDVAWSLIDQRKKVFLDSKVYDIGETAKNAVHAAAERGVSFLTIHGTSDILEAAVAAKAGTQLKLLAITLLTSITEDDVGDALTLSELATLGKDAMIPDVVKARTQRAFDAGVDGVIASGKEAALIRGMTNERFLIVAPGVRSAGVSADDQGRVVSPGDAMRLGADYIVMGRQIIRARDPRAEVYRIRQEMERGIAGS